MTITLINDIFSKEEIDRIYETVATKDSVINDDLGRILYNDMLNSFDGSTMQRLNNIVKDLTGIALYPATATYTEYNSLYGKPNLPPHLDRDTNDLIINIHLESNTDWLIGLNLDTYNLKNNSALLFNANKEVHWRSHKEFKDGEYVRMLFIRYCNIYDRSDYSYLPDHPDNDMFVDIIAFRDSLKSNGI